MTIISIENVSQDLKSDPSEGKSSGILVKKRTDLQERDGALLRMSYPRVVHIPAHLSGG